MHASIFHATCQVAYKELLDGIRHRAGYVTMGMFALTVIAFISMSLAGSMADGRLTAALLWVVIFFAATLQGERLFAEEAAAGTLLFLRIYVPAQAVLFGKMAAHFVTLLVLTVIVLPLILILMDGAFCPRCDARSSPLFRPLGHGSGGHLARGGCCKCERARGTYTCPAAPVYAADSPARDCTDCRGRGACAPRRHADL